MPGARLGPRDDRGELVSGEWNDQARLVLKRLAVGGGVFSADDLTAIVGPPDEDRAPNNRNNAIGAIFSEAARAGLIEVVGHTKSTTKTRKGGLIRVWRGIA